MNNTVPLSQIPARRPVIYKDSAALSWALSEFFPAILLNIMTSDNTTASPTPYKLSVFWGGDSKKQTLKPKGIENRKLQVFTNAAYHLNLPTPDDREPVISDFASHRISVLCDGEVINTSLSLLWEDIIVCLSEGPDSASMVHNNEVRVLPVKETLAATPANKKKRTRATCTDFTKV